MLSKPQRDWLTRLRDAGDEGASELYVATRTRAWAEDKRYAKRFAPLHFEWVITRTGRAALEADDA